MIRKAEARGRQPQYCSMGCYTKTGEDNPFWGKRHSEASIARMAAHPNRPRFEEGVNNPNFTRFGGESQYEGRTGAWWKKRLLRDIGQCESCGFDDVRLLTIHHIDRDRKHNTRANLELLCWNCHALRHFEQKDGFYHFLSKGSPEE